MNNRGLVTRDYAYFLENRLRERYKLEGVPLVIDSRRPRARELAPRLRGAGPGRAGWALRGVNPAVPPLLVAMEPKREAPDRLIARLAERQHRVVGRRQLLAAGLGAAEIRHRLECGRLFRLHPGVYSVGTADRARSATSSVPSLLPGNGPS